MFHGFCLIDVGHLLAEIARAGVNHKVNIPLIILVKLDEMVATTERPDCLVDTSGVFYLTVAVKFDHKLLSLTINIHFLSDKGFESETVFAHNHTRWHIATNMLMECVKVNFGEFAEIEDAHTAANVNAHYIGNYLVAKVAGETNDAARPGMNVGHNAYLLVGKHINRK